LISMDPHRTDQFLHAAKIVAEIAVAIYLVMQVRKPSKWLGRPFLWMMNLTHSRMTDWGLRQIQINDDFAILDVGCGGGRTIGKLAALAKAGKVYGVDYAKGSVAASHAANSESIRSGRVEIKQASVSHLPFPADQFNLVTAVETQYYWPNLLEDMKEVLRTLKPGGMLMVLAETYAGGLTEKLLRPLMKLLRAKTLSVAEQRELFAAAGFSDIQIVEELHQGWICAIGRKPSPS
jgi:SAM-dependent methyltransferase